jgi:cytochrome c
MSPVEFLTSCERTTIRSEDRDDIPGTRSLARRAGVHAFAVLTPVLVLLTPAAGANNDTARGEALLREHCGRCHAVGRTGNSAQKEAPAFRTLSQHYQVEALEESLAEGLMSGHPEMPEFSFSRHDVGAIIAYLKSIQQ